MVNFKLTEDQYELLQSLAEKLADGNMSFWIRSRVLTEPKDGFYEQSSDSDKTP